MRKVAIEDVLQEITENGDATTFYDPVNHPNHYADKSIEVIDYIRDTLEPKEYTGYCCGNVLKYVSRWRKKGGVEDLQKAAVYLDWAIRAAEAEKTH